MPNPEQVGLGYISPGQVSTCFCDSLASVLQRHQIGARFSLQSGPGVVRARNKLVKAFLETDLKYLWMVDTDMAFDSSTLLGLLDFIDQYKVLGALTFGQHPDGTVFPILKRFSKDEGVHDLETFERNVVLKAVTGTGCLMVAREVLESFDYDEPYRWFEHSSYGPQPLSEDVVFCLRAQEQGFPSYVHTGISVGHHKSRVVTEEHYETQGLRSLEPGLLPGLQDGASTGPVRDDVLGTSQEPVG